MKLVQIFKNAEVALKKHSPEILTGLGIAGMITTTVVAVKATPKALQLIENEKKAQKTENLKPILIVKCAWKCYIPAAVTGVASIGCLIGGYSVNVRRNAALATAYTLSNTALKEYRKKVIETVGEKKDQQVIDAIAKDKIQEHPVSEHNVIITKKGDTLCYDSVTGRYFKSDIDKIKKAINELNRRMLDEMYVSINDLYYELNLPEVSIGDDLGWNIDDGFIDVVFSSQLTEDEIPCLVMGFAVAPQYDYTKRM